MRHLVRRPVQFANACAGLLMIFANVHHLTLHAFPNQMSTDPWNIFESMTCKTPPIYDNVHYINSKTYSISVFKNIKYNNSTLYYGPV